MDKLLELHFRKYYNTIVKRLRYRTGTIQDAEDVAQEAYCRALKYKDSYKEELPLTHWFQRIINNAFKDWRKEQRGFSFDTFEEEDLEGTNCQVVSQKTVEEIAFLINNRNKKEHQDILTLYFIDEYPMRDVVAITGIKYKTAEQVVQRFKKEIKEYYEEGVHR